MRWLAVSILAGVLVAIGATIAIIFSAAGETNAEIFLRYQPEFHQLREKLKRIAQKLPPKGTLQGNSPAHNLSPTPIFNVKTREYNTAILMFEHLENPDRELNTPENFNIRLNNANLITHFRWTGPKNPMAQYVRSQTAKSELEGQLKGSLELPYLVVLRTLKYSRPVVKGNDFIGGKVEVEGFVINLKREQILASFFASGKPAPKVYSTFRQGIENPDEKGESWVFSSMWNDIRNNVAEALAETTGGTFVFKR